MSASVMLPNTPHTSTRSAGTAPAYDDGRARVGAQHLDARGRVRPRPSPRAPGRARRAGRARRPRRGWSSSTPSRSRPSPAHMLTTRIGPGGAASSASPMHCCTMREPPRRAGCRAGRTRVCHSCQSCGAIGQNHRMTYRVVQWATGFARQGSRSRACSPIPSSSSSAVGCTATTRSAVDVGEICGIGPIGVQGDEQPRRDLRARRRRGRVLAGDGEHPRRDPAARVGQERRDARRLDLSRPTRPASPRCRPRASRASATLHGTGINPGGITERFPLMLSALCRDITPRARRGVLRHPQLPDRHGRARGDAVRQGPGDRGQEPDDRHPRARVHAVDRHGLRRARLDARRREDVEARVGGRDAATWTRPSA